MLAVSLAVASKIVLRGEKDGSDRAAAAKQFQAQMGVWAHQFDAEFQANREAEKPVSKKRLK